MQALNIKGKYKVQSLERLRRPKHGLLTSGSALKKRNIKIYTKGPIYTKLKCCQVRGLHSIAGPAFDRTDV